jgi:hypothetical protein
MVRIRGIVVQATNEGWIRCREFAAAAAIAATLALLLTGQFNRAVVISLVRDTAEKNKLDPDDFLRMAEIESGLDPHARHPVSGASGLFQFLPSTARQYKLKSVFDAEANANAAAALWSDNSRALKKGLGRKPTSAELYLAHQQGARGAIELLTHPDAPAAMIVGDKAVTLNGGTQDMSAGRFTSMWITRFERD